MFNQEVRQLREETKPFHTPVPLRYLFCSARGFTITVGRVDAILNCDKYQLHTLIKMQQRTGHHFPGHWGLRTQAHKSGTTDTYISEKQIRIQYKDFLTSCLKKKMGLQDR